jgi:hypothetical protein
MVFPDLKNNKNKWESIFAQKIKRGNNATRLVQGQKNVHSKVATRAWENARNREMFSVGFKTDLWTRVLKLWFRICENMCQNLIKHLDYNKLYGDSNARK